MVEVLQYTDDSLFVAEANFQNVRTVKAILICFELTTSLRVNFHKSSIGAIGVDLSKLNCFANVLNCNKMNIPFTCLGLLVGGNLRRNFLL